MIHKLVHFITNYYNLPRSAFDHDQIVYYSLRSCAVKTRLIVIINKLEIIYTAWLHNGVLSILSLQPQSTYMYRPINTAQGEGESESVAAAGRQ